MIDDIKSYKEQRLRKRGSFLLAATKGIEVIADIGEDRVTAWVHDENGKEKQIAGPWKLLGFCEGTGKAWPLMTTEFMVFQAVAEFVAPLGYGHEEIAEAWDLLCEQRDAEMDAERQKCN